MSLKHPDRKKYIGKEFTYIWVDLPDAIFQETLDVIIIDSKIFQILQIPFYAENINQFDIVECKLEEKNKYVLDKVIKRSGYKTIHLIFSDETNQDIWRLYMEELEILAIQWTNSGKYFSISIPPSTDYDKVIQILYRWIRENKINIEAINKSI
jgi:hypothetical protein